ncbi:MAG: putative glycoside hydrolase, partial [Chthoniobacterales bacterium]
PENAKYRSFLITDPATGELAYREWDHCHYFDVLNPEFREWWVETAAEFVREANADGLFVDQMHGFNWLRPTRKKEVAKAQADMMRMAKQAIGKNKILLLNNGAGIPELFEIGDAFMFEHYNPALLSKEAILKDWEQMKKISQAGKIAVWRIGVEAEGPGLSTIAGKRSAVDAAYEELSKKRIGYYLAAFLMGAQPNCYFQYGWGWKLQSGPLVGYPEFQKPLGKPLGDFARTDPGGWIFKRKFEHASVWLDLYAREGKVEWK